MKSNFLDLIDFKKVDTLLEGFNKSTGFVTAILDLEGNILSKSGWRQICTEFHRINSKTSRRCTLSDTVLSAELAKGEKYHFYKCLNGLVDVAVPVVINGEHVANLFSGQFFFEKPDISFFRKQAKEFGFEEKEYIKALKKVPVVSKREVLAAMDYLLYVTQLISEMTYQKVALMELNQTLKESEERLRLSTELANVAVWEFDIPSDRMTRSVNHDSLYGLKQQEIWKYETFIKAAHPDDLQYFDEMFRKSVDPEGPDFYRFDFRVVHPDISIHWLEITGQVVNRDQSGNGQVVRGTLIDVTSRKQIEGELNLHRENLEELVKERTAELEVEKQNAQSADRLKSIFLATMSHELRTPLNSIIGFTGILYQEYPGKLNKEQKKQLEMIRNSSRHLLSLINDILDLSKIEAGQLRVEFRPFDLCELIKKVVKTCEPLAKQKNLELIVTGHSKTGVLVSDILRVEQILINLINNAIKFTDAGSVTISCKRNKEIVTIKVTDTGIGIEKEKINEIFQPFVQADNGFTRKREGTGLGLSICKRLLTMLNGSIAVESKVGTGSTFTIKLPLS